MVSKITIQTPLIITLQVLWVYLLSQKQTRHGPVLHSQKRNVYMERGPDDLTEHHESLDSFADQSTTSRMSLPAQRHAKDNSFVPIEKEEKDEEEEEDGNRSLSPFSESAMSLAEEAWKAFEKKTLSSPSLVVKSETEQNLSDDSLGSDDNVGKNTEDSPLKERVVPKRKLEREKEREVLNSRNYVKYMMLYKQRYKIVVILLKSI